MEQAIDSFSCLLTARGIYLQIGLFGLSQKLWILHCIHEGFLQCSNSVFRSAWRDGVKTRDRRSCLNASCDQFARFIALNEVERERNLGKLWQRLGSQLDDDIHFAGLQTGAPGWLNRLP